MCSQSRLSSLRSRRRLVLIMSLLVGLLVATSLGSEPQRVEIERPGLASISVEGAGSDYYIEFTKRSESRSDYVVFEANGQTTLAIFCDTDETIEIESLVVHWESQTVTRTTWLISVAKLPPVVVRPLGLSGDVFDVVVAIDRPREAADLAGALEVAIREVGSKTGSAARDEIQKWVEAVKLDRQAWKPFFESLNGLFAAQAKSKSTTLELLESIVDGLEAASGRVSR